MRIKVPVCGPGFSKTAWRMTKASIALLAWFPVVLATSILFYWSLPIEDWFQNFLIREPMKLVIFISVIIASYLVVYLVISLFASLIMKRAWGKDWKRQI